MTNLAKLLQQIVVRIFHVINKQQVKKKKPMYYCPNISGETNSFEDIQ